MLYKYLNPDLLLISRDKVTFRVTTQEMLVPVIHAGDLL